MQTSQLLTASTTPVVLVSACGLLLLALYNRLAAILARVRALHAQQFELLRSADSHRPEDLRELAGILDSQVRSVTGKARMVQRGLSCLLLAAAAFLCCSMLSAAAILHPWLGPLVLVIELSGIALFLLGIAAALWELSVSVTPIEELSATLQRLIEQRLRQL